MGVRVLVGVCEADAVEEGVCDVLGVSDTVRVAVPVADRDVYELDTAHWLELLHEAGYRDISHRYTDDAHLFCQYLAR